MKATSTESNMSWPELLYGAGPEMVVQFALWIVAGAARIYVGPSSVQLLYQHTCALMYVSAGSGIAKSSSDDLQSMISCIIMEM